MLKARPFPKTLLALFIAHASLVMTLTVLFFVSFKAGMTGNNLATSTGP
jgi:hypothetical protein